MDAKLVEETVHASHHAKDRARDAIKKALSEESDEILEAIVSLNKHSEDQDDAFEDALVYAAERVLRERAEERFQRNHENKSTGKAPVD